MSRAPIARRGLSRAVWAGGLLAVLLAALLGAWFVSGWHDVRMQQAAVRAAPRTAATARAGELARELRRELAALLEREARRPYFHYQNLMHDPRASAGFGVTPSPLATSPDDRFVVGYFQIDTGGRATTPTINDEVPALSDADHLAANRAFRDRVAHDLARELAAAAAVASSSVPETIEIDRDTYAQNMVSNQVYWQQRDTQNAAAPRATIERAPASTPVTITVSPLAWRTLPFGGEPALVASRHVQTPDGTLVQGFVVTQARLASWLAGKAGDLRSELHAGEAAGMFELVPGWQLAMSPDPAVLRQADDDAAAIARAFVARFIAVGAIALLVAAGVLVLVMRAEALARERSQFAAAAAHELRTPLAGLQLYGDMLADGLGDQAKVRDYARRMSEEAARLGRVVSNVLGFSQLERGNLHVDVQPASLAEALRELAERVQPALDRAGAVLDLDVAPELRARFDRDALARIVGNLLDNAEKYSRGADDRTIRLAARQDGDVVQVSVIDRGPGIADPRALFEPFARDVGPDGPAGLGIGLALSRSLARAMAGDLTYRAAEGGGTELVLGLPRA